MRIHILSKEIHNYLQNESVYGENEILDQMKGVFPTINNDELMKVIELFKLQQNNVIENTLIAELVVTSPVNIRSSRSRKTVGVLSEYINGAKKSILITGYSVSEFATDIIQLLKSKSSEGTIINFFVDKNVNTDLIKSVVGDGSNFNLYKLIDSEQLSNLHAKVAVFDSKYAFISSSNLSYNGIINNIEIGSLLRGKKVKEIELIFEEMLHQGFFKKL